MTTPNTNDIRWDLNVLYSGLDDPQLDKDIATYVEMAKVFQAAHKGKLAETLGQAIRDMTELSMLGGKFGVYLYLRYTTATDDAVVKAKMAEVQKIENAAVGEYLEFFEIEIAGLDEAVIQHAAKEDAAVAKHLPWLSQIRLFKPHQLSEDIESALTKRQQFSEGAWSEFFEELESDLRFQSGEKLIGLEEILHQMTESTDAEERARLLKTINDGLGGPFGKYSAQTLHMVVGSKEVEDRERGYAHPMHAANKSSLIPDTVVESLHRTVMEVGGPICRRYYRLKAAHLGLKTLRWSDRNAPMPFADNTVIGWNDAVALVHNAYASFSPTLVGLVDGMVKDRRIDVTPRPGKRGGAYNYSICLPGNRPIAFNFLNFMGSRRDVMTIAHELGHGCHGLLAGEAQGTLMMHAAIPFAETASIFGEMITFNFLKADLVKLGDRQKLLALIMAKCDDQMNTAIRQISFSNFERNIHAHEAATLTRGKIKKLSPPELDAIWLETTQELYGKSGEVFTYENAEHLWAYISHYHRPFYVYGYAFGELLTQSLYAARPRLGERFEPLYLDLLRAGNTKDVVELLKPFDLDPTDDAFWRAGLEVSLGKLVEEAEAVSKELGITV